MPSRRTVSCSDESGFTLIELLVVVLVIGILAATAIPAFTGQRDKAQGAAAKTAARNAFTAAQTYYVDNQSYTGLTRDALIGIEPSLSDAPWAPTWCGTGTGVYGDGQVLCVAMRAKGTSVDFEMRRDDSYGPGVTRLCSVIDKAGCRSGGLFGWGTW